MAVNLKFAVCSANSDLSTRFDIEPEFLGVIALENAKGRACIKLGVQPHNSLPHR